MPQPVVFNIPKVRQVQTNSKKINPDVAQTEQNNNKKIIILSDITLCPAQCTRRKSEPQRTPEINEGDNYTNKKLIFTNHVSSTPINSGMKIPFNISLDSPIVKSDSSTETKLPQKINKLKTKKGKSNKITLSKQLFLQKIHSEEKNVNNESKILPVKHIEIPALTHQQVAEKSTSKISRNSEHRLEDKVESEQINGHNVNDTSLWDSHRMTISKIHQTRASIMPPLITINVGNKQKDGLKNLHNKFKSNLVENNDINDNGNGPCIDTATPTEKICTVSIARFNNNHLANTSNDVILSKDKEEPLLPPNLSVHSENVNQNLHGESKTKVSGKINQSNVSNILKHVDDNQNQRDELSTQNPILKNTSNSSNIALDKSQKSFIQLQNSQERLKMIIDQCGRNKNGVLSPEENEELFSKPKTSQVKKTRKTSSNSKNIDKDEVIRHNSVLIAEHSRKTRKHQKNVSDSYINSSNMTLNQTSATRRKLYNPDVQIIVDNCNHTTTEQNEDQLSNHSQLNKSNVKHIGVSKIMADDVNNFHPATSGQNKNCNNEKSVQINKTKHNNKDISTSKIMEPCNTNNLTSLTSEQNENCEYLQLNNHKGKDIGTSNILVHCDVDNVNLASSDQNDNCNYLQLNKTKHKEKDIGTSKIDIYTMPSTSANVIENRLSNPNDSFKNKKSKSRWKKNVLNNKTNIVPELQSDSVSTQRRSARTKVKTVPYWLSDCRIQYKYVENGLREIETIPEENIKKYSLMREPNKTKQKSSKTETNKKSTVSRKGNSKKSKQKATSQSDKTNNTNAVAEKSQEPHSNKQNQLNNKKRANINRIINRLSNYSSEIHVENNTKITAEQSSANKDLSQKTQESRYNSKSNDKIATEVNASLNENAPGNLEEVDLEVISEVPRNPTDATASNTENLRKSLDEFEKSDSDEKMKSSKRNDATKESFEIPVVPEIHVTEDMILFETEGTSVPDYVDTERQENVVSQASNDLAQVASQIVAELPSNLKKISKSARMTRSHKRRINGNEEIQCNSRRKKLKQNIDNIATEICLPPGVPVTGNLDPPGANEGDPITHSDSKIYDVSGNNNYTMEPFIS